MPADLHLHTNFSDGTDTPEVLVTLAKTVGLTTISVTDHDTADGVGLAIQKGKELGVVDYFVKAQTPIEQLVAKVKGIVEGKA